MAEAWQFLTAPLAYPFMVRALLAAIVVGVVGGIVGAYVVLRGMAFFGDALSHAILPGLAVGVLLGGGSGALFWSALLTAILASVGIGAVSRGSRLKEDTSIGIIFAGLFALGIALISTTRSYSVDLVHLLFGDVLSVSWSNLGRMAFFGFIVVGGVVALYKEFMVLCFDPTLAVTLRLPSRRLYYTLLILIAVSIVVCLQAVGVALVLAMLVTPPATASLVCRRLPALMSLAAALGAFSGVAGLYISYYSGIASGAAIVLVTTTLFLLTFAITCWRRNRA